MPLPRLYLNHIPEWDWLIALEFGRVDDGQPDDHWRGVTEQVGFLLDGPDGPEVGFKILDFSEFDPLAREAAEIWDGPRFHVPQLGLPETTVGEIAIATAALLDGMPTTNRLYFSHGTDEEGEDALDTWLMCLLAGDTMAHFALGYTLYDLGRFHEAYRHLRYYTEIAPASAWNWCWLGKAAEAIGETAEARAAYERAIELEPGDQATDAAELLAALEAPEDAG